MTLLSGITFVAKTSQRSGCTGGGIRIEENKKRRKIDKKEKKEKKAKKHKRHKSSSDKKKEREHTSSSDSSDNSEDDSTVAATENEECILSPQAMQDMVREEAEEDRKKSTHTQQQQQQREPSTSSAKEKFAALMNKANSWKASASAAEEQIEASTSAVSVPVTVAVPVAVQVPFSKYISNSTTSSSRPDDVTAKGKATVSTNQSVAEQLRARLKSNKGALPPPPAPPAPSAPPAPPAPLAQPLVLDSAPMSAGTGIDVDSSASALAPAFDRRYQTSKALLSSSSAGAAQNTMPTATATAISRRIPAVNTGVNSSLAALVAFERSGGHDMDKTFANNVLRLGARYKGSETKENGALGSGEQNGMDEEEEVDDSLFEQIDAISQARRNVAHALRDQTKYDAVVSKCLYCMTSQNQQKHLNRHLDIYSGKYVGVRLKAGNLRLAPGHVEIFPLAHVESTLKADDETWSEMLSMKACLAKMNYSEGRGVCFTETAINFHRMPHISCDCIPIEAGSEAELQFSFQEALTDINSEFAQNAKIVLLTNERPLVWAIPTHFEYVAAEWGSPHISNKKETNLSKRSIITTTTTALPVIIGLAHVVQSEDGKENISHDFLLDVLAGVLDEDPMRMRKKRKSDISADTREAIRIKCLFERFLV